MFSARKRLIKLIAFAALSGAVCTLLLSIALDRGSIDATQAQYPVFLSIVFTLCVLACTATLDTELAQALGPPKSSGERAIEGWWRRKQMLLHWCPYYLLTLYLLAALVAIYASREVGPFISWNSRQPFTKHIALGFAAAASTALFAAVPILASASRMPGPYAHHFSPHS